MGNDPKPWKPCACPLCRRPASPGWKYCRECDDVARRRLIQSGHIRPVPDEAERPAPYSRPASMREGQGQTRGDKEVN